VDNKTPVRYYFAAQGDVLGQVKIVK